MSPRAILALALLFFACNTPSEGPKDKRPKTDPPKSTEATTQAATSEAKSADTGPASAGAPTELTLKVEAEPPKLEIAPLKSDPECEAKSASGKAELSA